MAREVGEKREVGRLLSVEDAADRLGTPVRFVRRLIHERRIPFHKIGKYVRIAESDLQALIDAGRIEPFRPADVRRHLRRAS